MGVQNLNTLVENQGHRVLKYFEFRKSKLVIDGSNLLHLLYRSSDLDQNHGGEYAAFEKVLESFVAALRVCEINPYVLLDGGSDPSDRKLETYNQRAEKRISQANNAALNGKKEGILPPLTREVFSQTLTRLNVPLAQCYREADQEIAALATEWRCPVLSDDSDFYIFQLPGGMLPIKYFQWDKVVQRGTNSYVPCKTYSTSSFCTHFKLRSELLPTFAMLGGNDYVKLPQLNWSRFRPDGGSQLKGVFRLEGLLHWLKRFKQPDDALNAALKLLKDQREEIPNDLRNRMTMARSSYHVPVIDTKTFFNHVVAPQLLHTEQDIVPDWIRLPLTQGLLMSEVLDVLVLKRRSLSFSVEKAELPSSNLCSRPLREFTYGLLLGEGSDLVVERDRTGLRVKTFKVTPRVTSAAQGLPLASLREADHAKRLQVLLEALEVTEDSLRELSPQLCLPVAVACYWQKNAQPPPERTLLEALMQGMTGNQRAASLLHANTPYLNAVHTLNQLQLCLREAMYLNQLLNFPLEEPNIARLFEGTLFHHLLSSTDVQQEHPLLAVICALAGLLSGG